MLLESLAADVAATAGVLRTAPDAVVHHCPGWSVFDLVAHHGGVLCWAAAIVTCGRPVTSEFPAPAGVTERADWYLGAATTFIDAVSGVRRDCPCWTFGRAPGQVWFWTRRQALEAAVHRWDAQFAIGRPAKFVPQLASAGITEVVDDLFPRQVALHRTPELSGAVELRATDTGEQWVLGRPWKVEATVSARADVLLLLLWRRADLNDPRLKISGSQLIVDELRRARLAP